MSSVLSVFINIVKYLGQSRVIITMILYKIKLFKYLTWGSISWSNIQKGKLYWEIEFKEYYCCYWNKRGELEDNALAHSKPKISHSLCNNTSKWLTSETAKKITDFHYSLKIVSKVLLMLIYKAILSFPHSNPAFFIPMGSVVDVSYFYKRKQIKAF